MVRQRRSVSPNLAIWCVLGCLLLAAGGCSNSLSSDQRLETALSERNQTRQSVFPLAGKVLVQGEPVQRTTPDQRVVVMLFDRSQSNLNLNQRPHAECDEKGEFFFTTYSGKDGVPTGEYVVAIAQLSLRGKDGSFLGPDGLKNLFNDPDKNAEIPEFTISHAAPGKTDYVFDLNVADNGPVSTPGPRAVKEISDD